MATPSEVINQKLAEHAAQVIAMAVQDPRATDVNNHALWRVMVMRVGERTGILAPEFFATKEEADRHATAVMIVFLRKGDAWKKLTQQNRRKKK